MSLLELRQSSAVPQWTSARLLELCGATDSRVLRVFPGAAARAKRGRTTEFSAAMDAVVLDQLPTPIEDIELDRALRNRRHVRVASAGGVERLLVPLATGDEVRHLVEVNTPPGKGTNAALADDLIPIVASYYDLLADAETDPLTRLANRRVFYSQVGAGMVGLAAGACRRYLALADIDHFKQINDRFGHLYGDEILIHFARLMRDTFRAGDLLYRFGGEEFVIVYAVNAAGDRNIPLERFRRATEEYVFPRVGRVTASIGFAALADSLVPATTYVDRADSAVYHAKRNGRNRVCEYEELVAQGALVVPVAEAGGEATLF